MCFAADAALPAFLICFVDVVGSRVEAAEELEDVVESAEEPGGEVEAEEELEDVVEAVGEREDTIAAEEELEDVVEAAGELEDEVEAGSTGVEPFRREDERRKSSYSVHEWYWFCNKSHKLRFIGFPCENLDV